MRVTIPGPGVSSNFSQGSGPQVDEAGKSNGKLCALFGTAGQS